MRVAPIAVVLAISISACSPAEEGTDPTILPPVDPPVTTATTVARVDTGDGGVARIGVLALPIAINPVADGGTLPSSTIVQRAVLPGAYVFDPETWQVVPNLVTHIPSQSDGDVTLDRDELTVTWTIRDEAVWSDGVPVSGADFAFTLEATLGFTECAGLGEIRSLFGFDIQNVTDKSISITMPGPTVAYETMFAAVLPAHATDETAVCTDDGSSWPSAGPFLVGRFDDETVELVTNTNYWRPHSGLARIEFVVVEDEAALEAAFEGGTVDVAVTSDATVADAARASGAVVQVVPTRQLEHVGFNFSTAAAVDGSLSRWLLFRQAVAHAIDTAAIADAITWQSVDGVLRGVNPGDP